MIKRVDLSLRPATECQITVTGKWRKLKYRAMVLLDGVSCFSRERKVSCRYSAASEIDSGDGVETAKSTRCQSPAPVRGLALAVQRPI